MIEVREAMQMTLDDRERRLTLKIKKINRNDTKHLNKRLAGRRI